jgi:hypothetical protein
MKKKQIILPFLAATALTISAPGNIYDAQASVNTYRVNVATGYLALRTEAALNTANEIGELYTGDLIEVTDYTGATGYWYVYSPKYDSYGYVNNDYLDAITSSGGSSYNTIWTVRVKSGYLALRSAKAFDSSNEIGQLYTGDTVWLSDSSDPTYWYVYSPKLNLYGYTDQNYLYGGNTGSTGTTTYFGETRTVHVNSGYLALRTMKAYDSSNEIGQLYTGDTVQILETSDPQYWYVYSPKYDLNGFVNKDYLSGGTAYSVKTISVAKGYLALRSAKSYDTSNEIGQLNTGDTVQVIDSGDSAYWYVYSPKLSNYGYVNKDYLY